MLLRRAARPEIVAVVADTHPNSYAGLCPPGPIDLGEGNEYYPSPSQKWLWECWLDYWQQVKRLAHAYQCTSILGVHVGDGADLNFKGKVKLIFPFRQSRAVDVCVGALQPGRDACDHWLMVEGTGVHVGPEGDAEEQVAEKLGAERDQYRACWTWDYLKLASNGVSFGFAHKPQTSSRRPWTRGGAANRQAAMNVYEYARYDELSKLPQLTIYAHLHTFEDSGLNHVVQMAGDSIGTRTIYCPSWQLHTPFSKQIGYHGDTRPHIGGLVFICFPSGDYILKPIPYFTKRRGAWLRQ